MLTIITCRRNIMDTCIKCFLLLYGFDFEHDYNKTYLPTSALLQFTRTSMFFHVNIKFARVITQYYNV